MTSDSDLVRAALEFAQSPAPNGGYVPRDPKLRRAEYIGKQLAAELEQRQREAEQRERNRAYLEQRIQDRMERHAAKRAEIAEALRRDTELRQALNPPNRGQWDYVPVRDTDPETLEAEFLSRLGYEQQP